MVYVMLGTGFEEVEALAPVDLLRRAGVDVQTVGLTDRLIYGGHGIGVQADITIDEMDLTSMDMIVLPGGLRGVASIRASSQTLEAVRFAWENDCFVAAICAGPTVLADLGITDGRKATCYPGQTGNMGPALLEERAAVRDGKLITGASAGCAVEFGLALVDALKGAEMAETIRKQIVIR
ncbi:MAG: DJ-1/PfpI family protein [Oscillospiraceae bacterium]|nr:DJ-1/PfpI family protein [Oscillospiraceae bacterium]